MKRPLLSVVTAFINHPVGQIADAVHYSALLRSIGLSIIIGNASIDARKWNEGSITEQV
jgi:hypothetical protein